MAKLLSKEKSMSLYAFLSVDAAATSSEIEEAYASSLQSLPKTGFRGWLVRVTGMANNIHYAYTVLSNPDERYKYDSGFHCERTYMYLGY